MVVGKGSVLVLVLVKGVCVCFLLSFFEPLSRKMWGSVGVSLVWWSWRDGKVCSWCELGLSWCGSSSS
jgi:hypothetical protein